MTVSEALDYLLSTDETCAQARALMNGLEKTEKTVTGQEFLKAVGTVAEREATARTSQAYQDWTRKYQDAWADYETQRLKRETAILHIEVWRTQSSNKRAGNI